jgi:hypothetical protein
MQGTVTQADLDEFSENGYLRIRGVLSRADAEYYRNLILAMIPPDLTIPARWSSSGGRIKPYHEGYGEQESRPGHQDNGIWDTPELMPLLCDERLYRCAAALAGTPALRVHDGTIGITMRNDPPRFRGRPAAGEAAGDAEQILSQSLHVDASVPRDAANFTFSPAELQVGGCFYLTDVEPRGGGMHVVPGGHKLVERDARAAGGDGRGLHRGWGAITGYPQTVEVTGEAGDFIMTHYLLPHAASHNRRPRARVAYFVRYSMLDHPFYPPPVPAASRFNDRQRAAAGPLGRQLLGIDPW